MTRQNRIELAKGWRKKYSPETQGGLVIFFDNEAVAWRNELRDPQTQAPGCIAINEAGDEWEAVGGNDRDGAEAWKPLQKMSAKA